MDSLPGVKSVGQYVPTNVVKHEESLPHGQADESKKTYHSYKKKYRKMKKKFEETMRMSNELCVSEQEGLATANRLAIEIDRILALLRDANDSPQMPVDKRIDLSVGTSSLTAIPDLISSEELARASEVNTPKGQAIYNEIRAKLDEKAAEKAASRPLKSIAHLLTTPHISTSNTPPDLLEASTNTFSYLTPNQIDEYISDVDDPPTPVDKSKFIRELPYTNPNSVYNWLRRNKPTVFLQDGEGSEKSNGKPGSLRGAGKRSSMPAPSKPDSLEIVEEDGIGYDPTISGLEPTKGKRKREDDGGYHPKLGAPSDGKVKKPRPKKKKVEGPPGDTPSASSASSSKKGKGKGRNSGDYMVVDESTPMPPAV